MPEAKTKQTELSVAKYIDSVADDLRRKDVKATIALMRRITKQAPKMWGTSIVGFGSYHYKYESGREGDAPIVGFSSRKSDLTMYVMAGFEGREALLAKLGKHKAGAACVYVKRLADIDLAVLEKLIAKSVAETKRRHPVAKKK